MITTSIIVLLLALGACIREIKNLQKQIKAVGKINNDYNNLYHKYLESERFNHKMMIENQQLLEHIRTIKPFFTLLANKQIVAHYSKN